MHLLYAVCLLFTRYSSLSGMACLMKTGSVPEFLPLSIALTLIGGNLQLVPSIDNTNNWLNESKTRSLPLWSPIYVYVGMSRQRTSLYTTVSGWCKEVNSWKQNKKFDFWRTPAPGHSGEGRGHPTPRGQDGIIPNFFTAVLAWWCTWRQMKKKRTECGNPDGVNKGQITKLKPSLGSFTEHALLEASKKSVKNAAEVASNWTALTSEAVLLCMLLLPRVM